MTIDSSKLIPKTEAIKFKTAKLVNVYSRSNFLDNRYLRQNIALKKELFEEKKELYESLSNKQNELGKDVKKGITKLGILGTGGGIGLLSRLFKKGKVPKVKITGDVLKNTKLPKGKGVGLGGGILNFGLDVASGTPVDEAAVGSGGFWAGAKIGAGLGFFIPDGPLMVAGELVGGLVGGLIGEAAVKKLYRKMMGREENSQDVVDNIKPEPVVNHFDNSLTLYSKSIEMMELVNWENLIAKEEKTEDQQDKKKVDPQTPIVEKGKDTITENNITEKEFHTTEITKIIEKVNTNKELTVRERTLLVDNGIDDFAVGGKTQSIVGDLVTLGASAAVAVKAPVIASKTMSGVNLWNSVKNTITRKKKLDSVVNNNVTPFNVPSGDSNVFFNQGGSRNTSFYGGGTTNTISWTEIIRQARTQ
mgnify:FL=1|tara:strand:+ start:2255 stop:3511 length:1257 start_codon:yes stop_codon:yes gene_type:complete